MSRPPSILIGVPSGENWRAITAACVATACMRMQHEGFHVTLTAAEGLTDMNQTAIARQVFSHPARPDAVWFVDCDMAFPTDMGMRLWKRNVPIVGCAYRNRKLPSHFTAEFLDGSHGDDTVTGLRDDMAFVATGMLMVRKKVFETIPPPWFWFTPSPEGTVNGFIGNDINFCAKARAHGFKIHCDWFASRDVVHDGWKFFSKDNLARLTTDNVQHKELWL